MKISTKVFWVKYFRLVKALVKAVWRVLRGSPANSKKFLTPLSFLRLRNEKLIFFQWIAPTFFALVLYFFVLNPFGWVFEFQFGGIFKAVNSFVGVLVGFYIAALAATATFPSEKLDGPLDSPTFLKAKHGKNEVDEELSRRRYMTVVFGYCAFLAFIILICGILQINVSLPKSTDPFWSSLNGSAFRFFWLLYLWLLSSLLSATLVGLHYLIDRMHRA